MTCIRVNCNRGCVGCVRGYVPIGVFANPMVPEVRHT